MLAENFNSSAYEYEESLLTMAVFCPKSAALLTNSIIGFLEIYGFSRLNRLICCEHYFQAIDCIPQMVAHIQIFQDSSEKVFLFKKAEAVVIRLAGGVDPLIGLDELVVLVPGLVGATAVAGWPEPFPSIPRNLDECQQLC